MGRWELGVGVESRGGTIGRWALGVELGVCGN